VATRHSSKGVQTEADQAQLRYTIDEVRRLLKKAEMLIKKAREA
jgi:hypothetical protein